MGAEEEEPKARNYDSEADEDKLPVYEVALSEYRIGRYPVTVCEYERFVEEEGYKRKELWHAGGADSVTGPKQWEEQLEHPTRPVVGIDWHEATAYAAWATSILKQHVKGVTVCLPTEAQWERAARGTKGRKYPWGDGDADPSLLNYYGSRIDQPTPVGVYPRGATPDGIADLAGNVWEWCSDWVGAYTDEKQSYPKGPSKGPARVLRGGSCVHDPLNCRSASRGYGTPDARGGVIGFRVVVDFR